MMSQRNSPRLVAEDSAEFRLAGSPEKFMSVMLTFPRLNVTKYHVVAKYLVVSCRSEVSEGPKAKASGESRVEVYRTIVERHVDKHTGLPHSAKACPEGVLVMETGGAAGVGQFRINHASRA